MMKIKKSMIINKIIQEKPEVVEILFKAGLTCIGCPMAQQETLEQGCKAHEMDDKEIKKLVERLNK